LSAALNLIAAPFRVRRRLRSRLLWTIGLNGAIGIVIALSIWTLRSHQDVHSLPGDLVDSLIHSAIYGITFGLAMPYLAERWMAFRLPWNLLLVLASLVALALLTTLVVQVSLLALNLIVKAKFWPEFGYKAITVFVLAFVIALAIWGYERVWGEIRDAKLRLRTYQLEKERTLTLLTEAKLTALEAKLHPHFLFNTLNSISALIPEQPHLAEEMIQRLAALLRISLDAHERSSISLREEILRVRDYCEIERIRLGSRLNVDINIPSELESVPIPAIVVQPLVENSIKYAISPDAGDGRIIISARRSNESLIISVIDSGPGFSLDEVPVGHSIDNLRSRLFGLFQEAAGLEIAVLDRGTEVLVTLPISTS
jgi:two-component system, LytTR family, sensor histidine kinase AlgZ